MRTACARAQRMPSRSAPRAPPVMTCVQCRPTPGQRCQPQRRSTVKPELFGELDELLAHAGFVFPELAQPCQIGLCAAVWLVEPLQVRLALSFGLQVAL